MAISFCHPGVGTVAGPVCRELPGAGRVNTMPAALAGASVCAEGKRCPFGVRPTQQHGPWEGAQNSSWLLSCLWGLLACLTLLLDRSAPFSMTDTDG